jgi:four helix bundle protein
MKEEKIEKNLILSLTVEFSLLIIDYCEKLNEQKKFILAKQLLRSDTAIGASCFEDQNHESAADFIHKFKIAAKESSETQYWLLLCKKAANYPPCGHLLSKLDSIDKVISKIISTSKKKKYAIES